MRLFATAPAVTQAFTPAESDDASIDTLLAARPRPSAQKLWVKVRQPVSIDELSRDLSMGSERLAMLNNVDTDHRFDRGEWLVVPAQKTRAVKLLSSVDTSELRRTPPLQSSPPLQSKGVVRLGDTVMAIAQRYGLTMAELLKLNPGMQTARLVAGNEVKLAQAEPVRQRAVLGLQSSPPVHSKGVVTLRDQLMAIADSDGFTMAELKRLNPDKPNALQVSGSEVTLIEVEPVRQRAVLGLKPSTSGGLSWPQIPGLGTDMTHPKPSNNRRLAFRQRLAAKQPAWRSYAHTQGGALLVNWGTWKLAAGGVRTADALHGRNPVVIAVHCDRLQFTVRSLSSNRWPAWDGIPPGTASAAIAEDLCTNLAK